MQDILSQFETGTSDSSGFFSLLSTRILQLLQNDTDQLFNFLYRIDVSEEKAKAAFALKEDFLIANKLSELIIERLNQKAATRKLFQ